MILKSLKALLRFDRRGTSKTHHAHQQPHSPVKTLAQLFFASSSKDKRKPQNRPNEQNRTKFADMADHETNVHVKHSQSTATTSALEETLKTFLTALRARKGNIVGRSILDRQNADVDDTLKLTVCLIKDPFDYERAAQQQVNVLFASFQDFLTTHWLKQHGTIVSSELLADVQAISQAAPVMPQGSLFDMVLQRLAPLNRWALREIIDLTTELLNGMQSDSDRGALVAGMTEILVQNGPVYKCIPLIDQMIEDRSKTALPGSENSQVAPQGDAVGLHAGEGNNSRSTNIKSSSLSKRLGMTSLRGDGFKRDQSSNVTDVMRNWSRSTRNNAILRPSLERTRSVGVTTSQAKSYQISQEALCTSLDARAKISVTMDEQLDLKDSNQTPTRKRRSSLSVLPLPNTSPLWEFTPEKRIPAREERTGKDRGSPLAIAEEAQWRVNSPTRFDAWPIAFETPGAQDCSAPNHTKGVKANGSVKSSSPLLTESANALRPHDACSHTTTSVKFRPFDEVALPGILTERIDSGNAHKTFVPPNRPRKGSALERRCLTPEVPHTALLHAQYDEIAYARARMSSDILYCRQTSAKPEANSHDIVKEADAQPTASDTDTARNVINRLEALETKIDLELEKLSIKVASALSKAPTGTSEATSTLDERNLLMHRVKILERQLRRKDAETEALYKRTNEELQKTFSEISGGNGVGELKARLRQSQNEALRWRKENERLRKNA